MGKGREQGYLRAEQACATSRGNPLFLIELAKEDLKGDTHTTQTSATGVTHVPGTVQDVVLSRVARLTAMEREYVDLASVIGVEFSGRLLCAVLSTMHDGSARIIDVLRTLARLERDTGLVRTRGPGFAFEHQLVRDAIYESVSGELRAHLHLAVAHGLEATVAGGARPAPRMAVSIVQHYLAACRPDDAFEYLDPAVEGLIAAHDYDLARAILDDFLRQSDPSDGPSRVMALSRRGVLALTTGTAQLDGHVIDELVVLTRQLGDSRRLRSALQMRAEALVVGRRFQEARDAVAEALTVPAESAGEPSDTQLRGMLGRIDLHAGDIDSARRNLQRVVTEATSPGERAIRLRARGNLAHLPPVTGAPDDSLSMMRACLEEAEALEDDRLVAQALLGLAYLQNGTGDTRQAYAAYQQLLVRTRRVGQRVLESVALSNTASLAFDLGRIAECIELASEALALAGEIRDPQGAVLIRLLQAEVEIWFGGLDESGRRLDALDRELEGSEDQQALSALSLYRGVHHTALGAGEAALTAFDLATQLSQDSQVTERSLLGAARNAALRGDHEGARRRLRTLMETPGAKHHRWVPAAAALIGALSEDVSPAEAHALLRDARDAIPRLLAIRGLRDLVDRGVHGEIAEDLNAMTDELVGGLPAQIDGASLRNHPLWSRATVG